MGAKFFRVDSIMNVISFCLYGSSPKYWGGLVKNFELAHRYFPGWMIRVYCDRENFNRFTDCANNISGEYTSSGVTFEFGFHDWCPPMLQRYLIADNPAVDRFISRDADSRLSQREADAVQEWINSDRICHVMRDHPAQQTMPGGMVGIQPRRPNWEMPKMERLIRNYLAETNVPDLMAYQIDQDFLAKVLWPMFRDTMLQHDSCPNRRKNLQAKPFPTARTDWPRFVGEVWECDTDGNEHPRPVEWESCPKE
jgi:hypothetical protein